MGCCSGLYSDALCVMEGQDGREKVAGGQMQCNEESWGLATLVTGCDRAACCICLSRIGRQLVGCWLSRNRQMPARCPERTGSTKCSMLLGRQTRKADRWRCRREEVAGVAAVAAAEVLPVSEPEESSMHNLWECFDSIQHTILVLGAAGSTGGS